MRRVNGVWCGSKPEAQRAFEVSAGEFDVQKGSLGTTVPGMACLVFNAPHTSVQLEYV